MRMNEPHRGMPYTEFLATICRLREVKTYLEVGVQNAINLSHIPADIAIGVDPELNITANPILGKKVVHLFQMPSDSFFRSKHADAVLAAGVDLAFLDGMHLFEYLLRDFRNAEARASRDGLIALHDCLPFDGEMIERIFDFANRTPGPNQGAWTGDVWKVVPILQKYRPDLSITLVDCFPTGLILISNLNPQDSILSSKYIDIVTEWRKVPNDLNNLLAFYEKQDILPSNEIIDEHSHSLYLKM